MKHNIENYRVGDIIINNPEGIWIKEFRNLKRRILKIDFLRKEVHLEFLSDIVWSDTKSAKKGDTLIYNFAYFINQNFIPQERICPKYLK